MLDIMRRKKRLKAILWVVIFSLALGMLLFFVPGMNVDNVMTDTSAATIDGRSIPMRDLVETYNAFRKEYSGTGRTLDSETSKALSSMALDKLIKDKIEEIIADRLGVEVTTAEVQNAIETYPGLQYQGKFVGLEEYKAALASKNISITYFEKSIIRPQELSRKIQSILVDSLEVIDRELKDEFSRTKEEVQVLYLLLNKDDFKRRIKPADSDLRAYFEAHKETYKIKERRKIQYLLVRTSRIIPNIKVTEEEIQQEWEKMPHLDTIQAAHILFQPKDPAQDTAAKAEAEKVLALAKSGSSFEGLAQKYSQDVTTRNKGGLLPPLSKGQRAREFEDVAFSLKPGQISEVVRTEIGYEIIKLIRRDPATIEGSRDSIINTIQQKKAKEQAIQKAEEAANSAKQQKDLVSAGNSLGEIAEVRETRPFGMEDNAFQFDISEDLKNEAFALKEINAIGKPVEHTLGYAVPKLLEVQMARPGDFSDHRLQAEKDYIEERASVWMQEEAKRISEEAGKQRSLEKVAKEINRDVKTSQSFKYDGTPDQEIGSNPAFNAAAFELPVGGVSGPIALMDKIAILQVKSRSPFDDAAFQKEKSQLRETLLSAKQGAYFREYLAKVMDELEKAGKIRVNQKALEQLPTYY